MSIDNVNHDEKLKEKIFQDNLALSKKIKKRFGLNITVKHSTEPIDIIEEIIFYYQNIINHLPGNVYWLDQHGRAVGCNQNVLRMFGFSSMTQFTGLNFNEMGYAGEWGLSATNSFKTDTLRVIKTGKPLINIEEPPIPHSDGRTTHYLTTRAPLRDKDKKIQGIIGISIDITQRKDLEKKLIEAKNAAESSSIAKSEFIQNMSHDLRTPLAGINGMAQDMINISNDINHFLDNDEASALDMKQKLRNISAYIDRDSQLLIKSSNELLDFCNTVLNSIIIGKRKLDSKKIFSLHDLVQKNVNLLQPLASTKKLKLQLHTSIDPNLFFSGQPDIISRSILNILSNALKFTEKGKVCVTIAHSHANIYQIIIKDTGIGIPQNKLKSIFNQFSTIDSKKNGRGNGTGLGLYTSREYITKIGGQITINSKLNSGSTFTISLPLTLAKKDKEKKTEMDQPKPMTDYSQKINDKIYHILIVEDNQIASIALSLMLKPYGTKVEIAQNGREALELAQSKYFDLIFMDIGLPDISGDDVTKQIRALNHPQLSSTPIIALTGHVNTDETKNELLQCGIQEILIKPARNKDLNYIFDNFLRNKSKD